MAKEEYIGSQYWQKTTYDDGTIYISNGYGYNYVMK